MEWLRMHPYSATVVSALLLVAGGAYIVAKNSPARPAPLGVVSWQGTGAVTNPIGPETAPVSVDAVQTIVQQNPNALPYAYTLPLPPAQSLPDASETSFDFNAFLATLSGQAPPISGQTSIKSDGSSAGDAYSFIPGGLISTNAAAPKRSPVQQDLYDYGNEVGSFIQSFETLHPNQTQTVQDQSNDRTDAAKAAALVQLGNDYVALGNRLLRMENVPTQSAKTHVALSNSYVDIGMKLALVPKAQRDSDFLVAIGAYNASVSTFITNYVALAQLFGSYGVVFSNDDSGSVFSFNPVSL